MLNFKEHPSSRSRVAQPSGKKTVQGRPSRRPLPVENIIKMDIEPIRFNTYEGLQGLAGYHMAGGELTDQTELMLEKTVRTPLIPAKLIELNICKDVTHDYTGIGKYMSALSWAVVEYDGKQEKWPLTMIYVKTNFSHEQQAK